MSSTPLMTPRPRAYKPIDTIGDLAEHVQEALAVELATIPPYLCALYSIVDPTADAYRLIRSVVIEEMLHMMQAANLKNAIGHVPSTDVEWVTAYPGFIPQHAAGGPFMQLQALSPALARTVFMPIEQPEASPDAPAEGDHFHTIGQFYKAIELGFEACVARYGEQEVFGHDTGFQRGDLYFGAGGGHLVVVHDLTTARQAITEITQQGEGATVPQPPVPYEEPFGGYDHYGERLDGTYGPILGVPWEMSHYRKFQKIADGEVAVPEVYPMRDNPSAADLDGDLRRLSQLFDACYTLILTSLGRVFGSAQGTEQFYGVAFPVMQDALPSLATLLMRTPLKPPADPSLGPAAGPSFVYRPQPVAEMAAEAEYLLGHPPDLGADYRQRWQLTLDLTRQVLLGRSQPGEHVIASPAGKRTVTL